MSPKKPFPLWPDGAPGALGSDPERDIPTLTEYSPASGRTSTAVIVSPGGGYTELMCDYEGSDIALWLNDRGITAYLLRYRLASHGYHHPHIIADGLRSVQVVRSLEPKFANVGMIGFSAGGHLTSLVMTRGGTGGGHASDAISQNTSRIDFGILCYPAINMTLWRSKKFLGPDATDETVRELSADLNVTERTPPAFIWHTYEDATVSVENPLRFASALKGAAVPFEMHIYEKGAHGLGLGVKPYEPGCGRELYPWTRDLARWLKERGYGA
jgi:acetyl esterase/lipase